MKASPDLIYQCYYMDNDGQKVIVAKFGGTAGYRKAVRFCQVHFGHYGTDVNYQPTINGKLI